MGRAVIGGNTTSVSLLNRLREGQETAAWERFIHLYTPLIYRWGQRRGLDGPDLDDLTQDVFASVLKHISGFEYNPSGGFRAWLKTIAENRLRDGHRRAEVSERAKPSLAVDATTSQTADAVFEEREYRRLLIGRAFEVMRKRFDERVWSACCRQVIDGIAAADVANEFGMTINQVYLAKSRVLTAVRDELAGLLDA